PATTTPATTTPATTTPTTPGPPTPKPSHPHHRRLTRRIPGSGQPHHAAARSAAYARSRRAS
ncbi:MAG: hypothetical protein M3071_05325, partial [Actinomycetota bacterium]|nr:hypothetical protein [Actinomycetota bacterium]